MDLPNTYTDKNETGCCPIPNIEAWDKQKFEFTNKHFIRMHTKSFLYMPINMADVMKSLDEAASNANAKPPMQQTMILSRDISPWKAEQLYAVSKPVEGADNLTLNGVFVTRVFEGPYKDAGKWHKQLQYYVSELGLKSKKTYLFYTTCPKCAEHYGKNYTIGLAEVE